MWPSRTVKEGASLRDASFSSTGARKRRVAHRIQDGVAADLQAGLGARFLRVNVPEFPLEEVHLVLKGFRSACGQHGYRRASHGGEISLRHSAGRARTDVLVQETDEGGGHDVPVFAAELHRRLDPVVHHQSQVLVDGVGTAVGEL